MNNTSSIPFTKEEFQADHSASLGYLISYPESADWNVKPVNPKYIGKSMAEEIEEETLQELKLYPKGEATLESIFMFGKHKGKQVEDMINDQKGYMSWLIDKEVITFDEETYQLLEEKGLI